MTSVVRLFGVVLLCLVFGLLPAKLYAQDSQIPFVDIVNIDRTNAPTVQLSVVGSNLGGDLSTLSLKLFEDDKPKTPTSDQTTIAGVEMALVIDPHDILAKNQSGQTHHAEVAGAILSLVSSKVVTRNVDLLGVYSMKADGSLQTIQEWTKEPNLIFNSTVQSKLEASGDSAAFTTLLVQVLDQFKAQSAGAARSLVIFSTGTTAFDVAKVVAKAAEQNVYIHTVQMATADQQPSQPNVLQQVAQQTHGKSLLLSAPQNINDLWTYIGVLRIERKLSFQSDSKAPAPIKVQLALPNGSTAEANFKPADWPMAASQAATVTLPATAPVTAAAVTTTTGAIASKGQAESANPAGAAPAGDAAPAAANPTRNVVIPGIAVAIPRLALELALPILILLLAYFIYRELRERRARTAQQSNLRMGNRQRNPYELSSETFSNLKPLPKNRMEDAEQYELRTDDDEYPVPLSEPLPTPRYTPSAYEEDSDEDATIVPRPVFGDDEATYRRSEQIEQPIVGYFVRVTGNPTLPNELPIYGLAPARGEIRQIHIGRHSKNNTVVINDKSISREHAVIVQKEGRLYLRDNASTAGTFLNGKRLQPGEELLLRHNDLASFGEVTYEFHAKGEDEATVSNG